MKKSTARDNQGRNLEAVKTHFDMLARHHEKGSRLSHEAFEELVVRFPLADWTIVDNVLVLRAGQSRFVACPSNGKKSAANFDVVDIVNLIPVANLKKDEVRTWLWRASQNEEALSRAALENQ